jgi:hypothetical protein
MPDWLNEASELLTWLTIASLICGGLAVVVRQYTRWLRDVIRDEIANHTSLIQPTSNGGKSLPDIARRLDLVMAKLDIREDEHK